MAQIFTAFLLASGIGTVLALILTLSKSVTRKVFSGDWHYYMWLVVLLVMVLPIRLNLPEKPVTTLPVSETVTITDNQAKNIETPIIIEKQPELITPEQYTQPENVSTVQAVKDFLRGKVLLFSFIWLMGAVLLFLIKIISYLIFLIKIHKHSELISCPEVKVYTNRKIRTRVSDTICSPLMIGIIRPTLLLPKTDITPEQLHNVLAHEMTHLKRNDILYKWFVGIVKCIHWFNPAIYFISKQINIDCEISCDLAVVKEMDEQQEKGYVETILSLLTHNNSKAIPLTTGMTGNKETLKRRFTMIKNKIKVSKKIAIISGILAVLILATTIFASGVLNGTFFKTYNNSIMELNTDQVTGHDFNLLFVGLDNNNRADTIMLIKVQDGSVHGLSIPRNTLFEDKRISDILASENGDQAAIDIIKQNLSVPIHYYAKLDLIAIKKIVDAVGGVDFDVPMNMVYDDPYQDLHINLKQGRHTLNGEEVCQLLQFRRGYSEGDLSRIQLHQQFLKEFMQQKLNKENIDKVPKIFKTIADNIQTNYQLSNFKQDMQIISAIKSDNIKFNTIAGDLIAYESMPLYQIDFKKIYKENGIHSLDGIYFCDTTPYEAWIDGQDDGWYILPTKTITATFPDIDTPISVTAYYAEVGKSLIQKLAKITPPYTYKTAGKVLSMNVPFPSEDIYGELWFVAEYEDGEKVTSEYFNVYRKAISDPPNKQVNNSGTEHIASFNNTTVTVTDIGCDDIEDSNYIYEYFTYDKYNFNKQNNLTLSKKDGTISFYYKSNKKQNIGIKLVETETGNIDAEYTITPEPNKIYTFNGLKSDASYEIVLDGQIHEPVYIVYQKYGENITPAPPEIQENGIGFSQIVFESDTSIKDIKNSLKKLGKSYNVSDYSYKDSLSSTKSNIACDDNGNISLFFDINAENLVDITFKDSATKKEVAKFGILASNVNSYSFTGFDKNKAYDIAVQGKTKDNWQIEGQYIIY